MPQKGSKKSGKSVVPRKKPVRLPLPFETAVEGLLAVRPRQKKKSASKKVASRPTKKN
jgi:hypothetical protein